MKSIQQRVIRAGTACILTLTTALVFGQQVIINTSGERIVIFPDGSWRTYQESDSVLLKGQLAKDEVLNADVERSVYEDTRDNPGEITGTTQMARQFADLTLRQSREANRKLASVIDEKFEVEARLRQAQENSNLLEPDQLADIEEKYNESADAVKAARRHQKKATKFAEDAQEVLNMPHDKREVRLSKLMVKHSAYYADRNDDLTLDETFIATSTSTNISSGNVSSRSETRTANDGQLRSEKKIGYYSRQPAHCATVINERDPRGKPEYIVIARDMLFKYTDEDLRPYFRDKAFLTCTGQLAQVGKNVFLNLEFSVASPNAQKNFGSLSEGSLLRLTLLDGSEIDLANLQGHNGQIDAYSGNTLFVGRYLLDPIQVKKASRSEIDKMRVVWSTGYEDYEVLDVDFLIDQIHCLELQQ